MIDVAIIGAGPSGLAAAKAASEHGLAWEGFETSDVAGGLWAGGPRRAWRELRTNLSRHSCAFSDHPWPSGALEFPTRNDVGGYLAGYAARFRLNPRIRHGWHVESVAVAGNEWAVTVRPRDGGRSDVVAARHVVVASGFFSRPSLPRFEHGARVGPRRVLHSLELDSVDTIDAGHALVVGGAFSGCEIAAELARAGRTVTHVVRRPVWVIGRYVPRGGGRDPIPLDLAVYSREEHARAAALPQPERNRAAARFFERTFGNPGASHPDLRLDPDDGAPPHAAVSDDYLAFVREGRIGVVRAAVDAVLPEAAVVLADGRRLCADVVVLCTGSGPSPDFLDTPTRSILGFDPADLVQPFVAHKGVFHPGLPRLALVGMYRGPFFGTIELQARWAAGAAAGALQLPSAEEMEAGVAAERTIRAARPQPQFPRGDYVGYADDLATAVGVLPEIDEDPLRAELWSGPLLPCHYRLRGPFANRPLAEATLRAVNDRL